MIIQTGYIDSSTLINRLNVLESEGNVITQVMKLDKYTTDNHEFDNYGNPVLINTLVYYDYMVIYQSRGRGVRNGRM